VPSQKYSLNNFLLVSLATGSANIVDHLFEASNTSWIGEFGTESNDGGIFDV